MSMVILPRSTDPDGKAQAQAKLSACIADPFAAVMIVSGEGPEIDAVIEVGSARASIAVLRRTVVWVRDVKVLDAKQKTAYAPAGIAAAFIGLNDQVVETLPAAKGAQKFWVEKAFTKAGG